MGSEELDHALTKNHENLNTHSFLSNDILKVLMEKYKHPILKDIEEQTKKVGGHGGMDYRLLYCLQKGLRLDMDLYDLAEWCCLIKLTVLSLENNSASVEIPDFMRGQWNKVQGLKFARRKSSRSMSSRYKDNCRLNVARHLLASDQNKVRHIHIFEYQTNRIY